MGMVSYQILEFSLIVPISRNSLDLLASSYGQGPLTSTPDNKKG